jgi:hypothetical protein
MHGDAPLVVPLKPFSEDLMLQVSLHSRLVILQLDWYCTLCFSFNLCTWFNLYIVRSKFIFLSCYSRSVENLRCCTPVGEC